jgi:hypothetical protein
MVVVEEVVVVVVVEGEVLQALLRHEVAGEIHQNLAAVVLLEAVADDRLRQFLRPIFRLEVEVQVVMESGVGGRLLSHPEPLLVELVEVELVRKCLDLGMILQLFSHKTYSEMKLSRIYGSGYPGLGSRSVAGRNFPFGYWPLVWGVGVGSGIVYLRDDEVRDFQPEWTKQWLTCW